MKQASKELDILIQKIGGNDGETKTDDTDGDLHDIISKAKEYIAWEPNKIFKSQVETALNKNDVNVLKDMFGKRIAFGTAGLRAKMKGGYKYINDLIIIQTSQGLLKYAENNINDCKNKGIIVGYDGRYNSKKWCETTLKVFLSQKWKIYWFNRFAATPMIPFGMLLNKLKCALGIVVTASHNPKEYNGYKVYWENGAQIIPPNDVGIAKAILNNLKPWENYDKYNIYDDKYKNISMDVTDYVINSYFNDIKKYCYNVNDNQNSDINNKLIVTYTAMHGVGGYYIDKAYESFKLPKYIKVKEQYDPDPEFKTVAFPNPEEGADSLELAIKTANANSSTLILANDPDADRLAVAEKINGEWKIYNGNEIATLFSDYAFQNYIKKNPNVDKSKLFMVASTVSSKYLGAMAKKEGFQFYDTLTGFKWIGNKAIEMVNKGYIFLFGYEVEIGFLMGNISYDKDGIRMCSIFHELALQLYKNGQTCFDKLNELRKKYGYFEMVPSYRRMTDELLIKKMKRLRYGFNGSYPKTMGKFEITRVRDVTTGYDSFQNDKKCKLPIQPNSEMITFWFKNGATVTLRNSGTEPKLKYYIETKDDNDPNAAKKILDEMHAALLKEFMQMK